MSILGSAIIGGASLLGNALGSASQSSTNKQNLHIAQMNNDFNERMMNKQMQYNIQMFDKQNEYNSASNQRKRLEQAGLNPYLMMNGGSAGTAQSAGGVTPATANGATMQSYRPDFSAAADMVNYALQEKQNKAQVDNTSAVTQGQLIDNSYKKAMAQAQLSKMSAETDSFMLKNKYQKIANSFAYETLGYDANNKRLQNDLLSSQTKMNEIKTALDTQALKAFPQRLKYELADKLADIQLKYKQGSLSDSQAKNLIQSSIESSARTSGIQINNKILDSSVEWIIERNRKDSMHRSWQSMVEDGGFSILDGIKSMFTGKHSYTPR